jgi:hypothetical protein
LPSLDQVRSLGEAGYWNNTRQIGIEEYIVSNSSPSDRILMWGDQPQIYFLTDRLSPSRYLYATQLLLSAAEVDFMLQEFFESLSLNPPQIIIYQSGSATLVPHPGLADEIYCPTCSTKKLDILEQVDKYISSNYHEEIRSGEWIILVRN